MKKHRNMQRNCTLKLAIRNVELIFLNIAVQLGKIVHEKFNA
jgi:hypothetical protein